MMSKVDHIDAFYTSKWDGIATPFCPLHFENCTYMLLCRKDTRFNDAHLQTPFSKMQKRPKMSQHVKQLVLASRPLCQAVMNKTQVSKSCPIYGNMPIQTTSHAGNQLSMVGNFSHCAQVPQKVLCEADGSPNDDKNTVLNELHLLRMKLNKKEGRLTHAMHQ